jgi:hypothetical protein
MVPAVGIGHFSSSRRWLQRASCQKRNGGGVVAMGVSLGKVSDCLTYISPTNGPTQRPNPIVMPNMNAVKQLRCPGSSH